MFIEKNEVILNSLYEQAKTLRGQLNNYVLIIVFIIDKVKNTFGIRGSSHSESNHHSVKGFVIRNVDGIHGAMQELMKRQKTLMLKNNHEIA